MAPDLNSVPPSPHTQNPSAITRQPPQPMTSPSASGQLAAAPQRRDSISTSPPMLTTTAANALNAGSGPIRHPRPLTAAELHLELEKEQEGIVNRLSRELSSLRQQTASAVSNASSTSAHHDDTGNVISTPIHPTATRQHRSSSNLSSHSTSLAGLHSTTVSGIAPARDSAATPSLGPRGRSSRQGSMTARRQEAVSPSLSAVRLHGDGAPPTSVSSQGAALPNTTRLDEIAHHRAELERARRENESLRQRVQELERQLTQSQLTSRANSTAEGHSPGNT